VSDADFFERLAERLAAPGDGPVRPLIPSRFESSPALPPVPPARRAGDRGEAEEPS